MPLWVSFLLIVLFLAINAFFVVAEFAMVRIRPSRIDLLLENGARGAKAAKIISQDVNAYLAACQLGITLVSLALGWLGEAAFSELAVDVLGLTPLSVGARIAIGGAIGYMLLTMFHVVVGEQIPKAYAIYSTEQLALITSPPLLWFYRITYPIMVVFNAITRAAVRLGGHDLGDEHEVYTDEEIRLLIDESTESGLIDADQNEYVDNIFDMGERDAESIMTPRTDMICVDLERSLKENMETIRLYKYSRYPVCRGSKDRVVGFVHVKDLFCQSKELTMDNLPIHDVVVVPESMPEARLLQTLQDEKTKMAVVIDEHGGTAGIVTISDIMEQIVGRIDDEYRHIGETGVIDRGDGLYEVEGLMPVEELVELMGFRPSEADEVETAGGLLFCAFDRIPAEGDMTTIQSDAKRAVFTVLEMDKRRIDRISMKLYEVEPEETAESEAAEAPESN